MELWIRSQDKNILINANNIYKTNEFDSTYDGFEYYIWTDEQVIGIYKTEERALEILDEIQRLITDLQYMSYAIPNDKFAGYRPNVYEMPKE